MVTGSIGGSKPLTGQEPFPRKGVIRIALGDEGTRGNIETIDGPGGVEPFGASGGQQFDSFGAGSRLI